MRGIIAVALLIAGTALVGRGAEGGEEVEAIAQRGIERVYNLEFESAEEEFQTLVRMNPRDPAGYFFLAMVDWWRILIDLENESRDERFHSELDRVIELCDSLLDADEKNVDAAFFKGGALGFQGRLQFHRNDYLGAANAGRRALPLVETAYALAPSNADILLGTGIYNYYAEVIPNEYPWVKPLLLFIPAGDKKKGMEQLAIAAQKGRYASVEATYFLLQIEYFYERRYDRVLEIATSLNRRFPRNMLFHSYLGRAYASLANWGETERVFTQIASRAASGMRGYTARVEREAEYYRGWAQMMSGRFDEALARLYRCDELSRTLDRQEPSGFMVVANLKVGNIYDLQGKRELAVAQYNKVLGMKEYKDSASQARRFIAVPYSR
jgi:tetratricopeptide (TPR) repeat protein